MKLAIEPTDRTTEVAGVPFRIWTGTTENGVRCALLVHRVMVPGDADHAEFDKALKVALPPRTSVPIEDVLAVLAETEAR